MENIKEKLREFVKKHSLTHEYFSGDNQTVLTVPNYLIGEFTEIIKDSLANETANTITESKHTKFHLEEILAFYELSISDIIYVRTKKKHPQNAPVKRTKQHRRAI